MTAPMRISEDPTREQEQELDFYVSVMDGPKFGLLLGPYEKHAETKTDVERGRRLANEADPWAAFYGFGTASLPRGTSARVAFS